MAGPSRLAEDDFAFALRLQLEEAGAANISMDLLHRLVPLQSPQSLPTNIAGGHSTLTHKAQASSSKPLFQRQVPSPVSIQTGLKSEPVVIDLANGDAMSSSTFKCPICLELCPTSSSLVLGDCKEPFCKECIITYLTVTVKEQRKFPIPCPQCSDHFDPDKCLEALAGTDLHGILDALIVEKKFFSRLRYCVNPKCGTAFDWVDDDENGQAQGSSSGKYKIKCPMCSVTSCVKCNTEWHSGQSCAQYKANKKDTDALAKLTELYKWMPCPKCSELIERRKGDCNFMKCRCGTAFCHNCGVAYLSTKKTTRNAHGKPGCRCGLFTSKNNAEQRNRRLRLAIATANRQNDQSQTASSTRYTASAINKNNAARQKRSRRLGEGGKLRNGPPEAIPNQQAQQPAGRFADEMTAEQVFTGRLCNYAFKRLYRLIRFQPQVYVAFIMENFKNYINYLWTSWISERLTKQNMEDSITQFVRSAYQQNTNFDVVTDFYAWYQAQLDAYERALEATTVVRDAVAARMHVNGNRTPAIQNAAQNDDFLTFAQQPPVQHVSNGHAQAHTLPQSAHAHAQAQLSQQPNAGQPQPQQQQQWEATSIEMSQSNLHMASFCWYAVQLVERLMQSQAECPIVKVALQSHMCDLWRRYIAGNVSTDMFMDSVGCFIATCCPHVNTGNAAEEFRSWYKTQRELQEKSEKAVKYDMAPLQGRFGGLMDLPEIR